MKWTDKEWVLEDEAKSVYVLYRGPEKRERGEESGGGEGMEFMRCGVREKGRQCVQIFLECFTVLRQAYTRNLSARPTIIRRFFSSPVISS